jgi:hypothetical protein
VTEGWFHTQGLTNNGIYGKARQRDEGIPPYRDKIPFGVYTKKAELLTALLLHFMGIS